MPTVRYTGDGGRYRTGGVTFEPGDEAEVALGLAKHLVEDVGSFEHVDADAEDEDDASDEAEAESEEADADPETKDSIVTAPGEFTIDEIEAELETGEWDDHLETLRENEENGKDRAGVYDALGVRRAEIEG
ncbi:hypothetical protein [Natrinema salifodinae]|uniref:Uncharacterized protein n=1 Tax=Natrinema salifodinae TaxID=1202768 RepID=A0A1I0P8E7_9EURY|nr:hypothetical protein [Natrinema salifodinae]SEW10364.1 hypothetical protein SAMN05216285_2251 [Natrinema salifodinae]